VNKTLTYNLQGYFIFNGLTTFQYDGYYRNAIELLAHFNIIPMRKYEEYVALNCSLIDNVIKDRPNYNKEECLEFIFEINRVRMSVNF
jgi:hypothetical protein